MPPISDRIARFFRRTQPPAPTSATGLEDAVGTLTGVFPDAAASTDRLQTYADVERMDNECPEAAAALDAIASLVSAAPGGGDRPFQVEWEPGSPAGAQAEVEGLLERTRLG
ncbi:MAG: hypothetical protein QHJ73_20195, partial [Armatimonadota bacterium]|nr:hypothetical protein [Armatimonadota bacterium]